MGQKRYLTRTKQVKKYIKCQDKNAKLSKLLNECVKIRLEMLIGAAGS